MGQRHDLEGRKAIVTGGASGIGLAIARRLTASGATVALWDLSENARAAAKTSLASDSTHRFVVDISDDAAVAAATTETLMTLGCVGILVNSAGITGPNASFEHYPANDWHEIAAMIAWLCTEECSFSTGATFALSGGRATYEV